MDTTGTLWLTATEAAKFYHVRFWTVIKAVRHSNIQKKRCTKRWLWLYSVGPELAAAIENYIKEEQEKDKSTQHPVNQALNRIIAAFR